MAKWITILALGVPALLSFSAYADEVPVIEFQTLTEGCYAHGPEIFKVKKSFITDSNMDGAWLEDQDRHIEHFYVERDGLPEVDQDWLPTLFWEGRQVKVWYERCGVSGRTVAILKATSAE